MKIVGMDVGTKFYSVLSSCDPALKFNITAAKPGVIEGYLYYKAAAATSWRCYRPVNPPEPVNKPCAHMAFMVARKLLQSGATAVWVEKYKLTLATATPLMASKIEAKYKNKGLVCQCPVKKSECFPAWVFGANSSVSWQPTPAPPLDLTHIPATSTSVTTSTSVIPPKPVTPLMTLDAAPIEGPAVSEGETASVSSVRGVTRDVALAVTGLYVLSELELALDDAGEQERAKLAEAMRVWSVYNYLMNGDPIGDPTDAASVFREYKTAYTARLARNMFDYLTMASAGEARHKAGLTWPDGDRPVTRSATYQKALEFDPRAMLPVLIRVFTELHWSAKFGGPKWANIARAATQYIVHHKHPLLFLDHCVDLSHNGGMAFDKGYILQNPTVVDTDYYRRILDAKRDGSLLFSTLTLPVSPTVLYYVSAFVAAGLIDTPAAKLTMHIDKSVPTLTWGSKPFTLGVANEKVTPSAQVFHVETYPDPRVAA